MSDFLLRLAERALAARRSASSPSGAAERPTRPPFGLDEPEPDAAGRFRTAVDAIDGEGAPPGRIERVETSPARERDRTSLGAVERAGTLPGARPDGTAPEPAGGEEAELRPESPRPAPRTARPRRAPRSPEPRSAAPRPAEEDAPAGIASDAFDRGDDQRVPVPLEARSPRTPVRPPAGRTGAPSPADPIPPTNAAALRPPAPSRPATPAAATPDVPEAPRRGDAEPPPAAARSRAAPGPVDATPRAAPRAEARPVPTRPAAPPGAPAPAPGGIPAPPSPAAHADGDPSVAHSAPERPPEATPARRDAALGEGRARTQQTSVDPPPVVVHVNIGRVTVRAAPPPAPPASRPAPRREPSVSLIDFLDRERLP